MEFIEKTITSIFSTRQKALAVKIVGTNTIDPKDDVLMGLLKKSEERKSNGEEGKAKDSPKPTTAYTFECTKGPKIWRLQKKVVDIIKLREELLDQKFQVPKMHADCPDPAKNKQKDKLFEFETPFVRQIWLTMEHWINALINHEVIGQSPNLNEFLEISKHLEASRNKFNGGLGEELKQHENSKRRNSSGKVCLEDFILLKVVGKGSFGKVMQVMKIDTKEIFAMKVLKKQHVIKRNQVEHTKTERNVLATIDHPFIVSLRYAFQNRKKLFLVLDYCPGGELFFHLSKTGKFKEKLAKFYCAEIVLAIEYLHSLDIVYRDLKPENVLLDKDGHVQLTDFGLSKEGISDNISAHSFCGTPEYLAPEILQRIGHGRAADWWSLGTLLYEMLTGMPPFYSRDRDRLFKKILSHELRFPVYFSSQVKSLLRGLMHRNPSRRLGSRDDAVEVKAHPFFDDIDWQVLSERRIEPPFKPKITPNEYLVDPEFLELPVHTPEGKSQILKESDSSKFIGFTYVGDSQLSTAMEPAPEIS